jgi:pullulanase/glycogen debranching enzyme
MDRNSYNSGDWFNKIDWTGMDNNWGAGLPPAQDNQANWSIMQPLLANPALDPGPADIAQALAHFKETLKIRQSTRLLRLRTAAEIEEKLRFHNTGPGQIPGLIVFSVTDAEGEVVVFLNARPEAVTLQIPELAGEKLALHPEQRSSADPVVRQSRFTRETGTFRVPGRTAAVFVQGRL